MVMQQQKIGVINIISSAMCWSLWKLRNALCFQDVAWKNMKAYGAANDQMLGGEGGSSPSENDGGIQKCYVFAGEVGDRASVIKTASIRRDATLNGVIVDVPLWEDAGEPSGMGGGANVVRCGLSHTLAQLKTHNSSNVAMLFNIILHCSSHLYCCFILHHYKML
jgi:hypothetical protein